MRWQYCLLFQKILLSEIKKKTMSSHKKVLRQKLLTLFLCKLAKKTCAKTFDKFKLKKPKEKKKQLMKRPTCPNPQSTHTHTISKLYIWFKQTRTYCAHKFDLNYKKVQITIVIRVLPFLLTAHCDIDIHFPLNFVFGFRY